MDVQLELTSIRVDLEEDLTQQFQALKKYHGIRTTTDMVRFLITDKYRTIFGPKEIPAISEQKDLPEDQSAPPEVSPNDPAQISLTPSECLGLDAAAADYYARYHDLEEAGLTNFLEDRYPSWPPEKIQEGIRYISSIKQN